MSQRINESCFEKYLKIYFKETVQNKTESKEESKTAIIEKSTHNIASKEINEKPISSSQKVI